MEYADSSKREVLYFRSLSIEAENVFHNVNIEEDSLGNQSSYSSLQNTYS